MNILNEDRKVLKKLNSVFKELVDLTVDFSEVCIKPKNEKDNATRLIMSVKDDLDIVDDEIRKLIIAYKMARMDFEQLEQLDEAAERILSIHPSQ